MFLFEFPGYLLIIALLIYLFIYYTNFLPEGIQSILEDTLKLVNVGSESAVSIVSGMADAGSDAGSFMSTGKNPLDFIN
jgi:hypothetical protein